MANLFALIVGINEYQESPLSGCVRDAQSVRDYLQSAIVNSQFEKIHLEMLLNSDATKTKIIAGFREHLNQAERGDTIVFYFSGHGGREKTEYPIFQSGEIDDNLGSLICSGFISQSKELHQFLLSNKEIRYLIQPLANRQGAPHAHVVMIFDCCHSGSNTRSIETVELPSKSRQILRSAMKGRTMDQFLFAEDPVLLHSLQGSGKSLDSLLPQGEHVMLAACREVELAWETSTGPSRGVFTDALLHVLTQHQGKISYQELYTRILNRMTFSVSESQGDKGQTPQVYVKTNDTADRFRNVFTQEPHSEPAYGAVVFLKKEAEWRLALGAFHGVTPDKPDQKALVYPAGKKEEATFVEIKEVYPFYCILNPAPSVNLSPESVYRGEVTTLGIAAPGVFIDSSGLQMDAVQAFLTDQWNNNTSETFQISAQEELAEYVLSEENGKLIITAPFERARPLLKRVGFLNSEGQVDEEILLSVYKTLSKIGQWSLLKKLEYSAISIPDYLIGETEMFPVEFRLFQWIPDADTEKRIYANDGKFSLILQDVHQPLWIRYEIINHADQALNVSLAIMTQDFGFLVNDQKNGLKGPVITLMEADDAKGGNKHYSIPAPSGTGISIEDSPQKHYVPISIDPYYTEFNVPGESTFFKLVVSTKALDPISVFHEEPMGYPKKEDAASRSYMMVINDETNPNYPSVSWDLKTIEVYVTNPEFQ